MKKKITLSKILKTNIMACNPSVNFVSSHYDNAAIIIDNGVEKSLEDSVPNECFSSVTPNKNFLLTLYFRNAVVLFLILTFFNSIGTVFQFVGPFLPNDDNYWKFMIFEFSAFSALLFGFCEFLYIYYSKKEWTKRCFANGDIIKQDLLKKCSFESAKEDVSYILSRQNISFDDEKAFPYGDLFFLRTIRAINKFEKCPSFKDEYTRGLNKISACPTPLKAICSLAIAFSIQVFSFLDLYQTISFKTNLIAVAILIVPLSFLTASTFVKNRYLKSYIKLNALLFLYSYMFLDAMPFKEPGSLKEINYELFDSKNQESSLAYFASKLSIELGHHVCVRDFFIKDNKLYYSFNE